MAARVPVPGPRPPSAAPLLLALLALAPACRRLDPEDFADLEVQAAWISGLNINTLALVVGPASGGGDLWMETTDGEVVGVPVVLRGGTAGFSAEMILLSTAFSEVELELPGVLTGDQLMGYYRGTSASLVTGAGVETHHLRNEWDVELDQPFFTLGAAVMYGFEWLNLVPVRGEVDGDTGGA
jgi:hypothetical protein